MSAAREDERAAPPAAPAPDPAWASAPAPAPPPRRFRLARHDVDPSPAADAARAEPTDPTSHFDLWLERPDGLLTSFRLDRLPGAEPGASIPAIRIFDHRLVYLDREGDLGPGRGRGRLTHVARGTYRVVREADGILEVELFAADDARFGGRFVLARVNAESPDAEPWILTRVV